MLKIPDISNRTDDEYEESCYPRWGLWPSKKAW